MSYHIVDISSEGVILSTKNRQLVCRGQNESTHTLPMEDIGAVVVNSFSASLHNSFLAAAGAAGIPVIICERFKPKSVVLPVQRGGDTLLTRAQIAAPSRLIDSLWVKTVNAKVVNQLALVERLAPHDRRLSDLSAAACRQDVSKEGNCARLYWSILSKFLRSSSFRRNPDGDGVNSLLNYSYGVLLSRVLQRLLAFGLDPMYGIGHAVRERAVPLAYDVMEPFRPAFDAAVVDWLKEFPVQKEIAVDADFKRMAQGVMKLRYPYLKMKSLPLEDILDLVIKSLRLAFIKTKITEYRPWIWRSSVWAG